MLFAIILIVLGLFLLLNAMGIIVGNFWGFFWAVVFLAIGLRMLTKKRICPMCEGMFWSDRVHAKIHSKMHGNCDCECEHDNHGAGESKAPSA